MVSFLDILFILTHRPHLFTVTTMLSEGSRTRAEFNPRLEKIVSNTKRMSLERLSLSPKKLKKKKFYEKL